eukprot:3969228-Amphidinium_carterae.1
MGWNLQGFTGMLKFRMGILHWWSRSAIAVQLYTQVAPTEAAEALRELVIVELHPLVDSRATPWCLTTSYDCSSNSALPSRLCKVCGVARQRHDIRSRGGETEREPKSVPSFMHRVLGDVVSLQSVVAQCAAEGCKS